MKKLLTIISIMMVTSLGFSQGSQIDLPVTFDDPTVNYSLTDFGGNSSALVVDPAGGPNMVAKSIKTLGAMSWAGTTMGPASGTGFATPIPFSATETKMNVRVYSPAMGIPIRLKVEDATDPTKSVETQVISTMANAWETLEFDFSNQAPGTAALNLAFTFDKASIFFHFGTDGMMAGADTTYYWDDVKFGAGGSGGLSQIDLPVTFDAANVDYSLTDFGGNSSALVVDPSGGPNMVARSIKTLGAMSWAGTTMGPASGTGFATAIPFTATNTKMKVRVYSPAIGIPIRLKVEDATNGAISAETEATSTMANAWETLEFDFNNPAMGTAALNLANTYDKASIFFYFGTAGNMAGADTTYYWDDVEFVGGGSGGLSQIDLPVTFDDATVDYSLTDFGGNSSALMVDPAGGPNMVSRSIKTLGAMSWAGTTMGPASGTGFATAIPFTASNTKMKVRVYSPAIGIPIRLKVEDATNGAISAETEATSTMANAWETLEFDFNNPAMGTAALNLANTYDKASIFFYFGTAGNMAGADTTFYWDDVEFVGGGSGGLSQIDLPVTFDDATVDYSLTDFGGNSSALMVDPAGGPNMVARSIKTLGAMSWAGTTMGPASGTGFATAIPFTATNTKMKVRVYSPAIGIPIRLKVEDATNGAISAETEATSTMANAWETLEFDFNNPAMGTAALNPANTYDKASVFFYFGTDGMMAGADTTFYWDDVEFVGGGGGGLAQIDLPVTFDDATVDYSLTDFGGNSSALMVDPAGGPNMVARSIKTLNAMSWAGTTMGPASGTGFATPIPFTAAETKMNVRVYSPAAGIPIRLKVEDATDPTRSVETEAMSTMANAWETLEFDFNNEAPGTAALNLAFTFDKASIFFYFGTDGMMAGADTTFYWDDVKFGAGGGTGLAQIDLPVTFDDATVDYSLTDFGGNSSALMVDPAGGPNMVARSIKTLNAMSWAGTTMGPASGTGFATPIPFTAAETKMNVRVYSPAAGIPIRLKVEDATDGTKSVETEATTTVANAWEVLEFDFDNEAMGTAALDLANTYDKASIFFYFGTDGMMAGADTTFYWDDVAFGAAGPVLSQIDLTVTFDDATVDYSLTDFGGNSSALMVDPAGGPNMVARSIKTLNAMSWAGTTMGPASGTGFATAIPFTTTETKMNVRVYSPAAGIPIRMKVEDAANNTISVETEDTTTMANAWETLEFDFSNEVSGTAALDIANTYDKASIFFHFGTDGASAGADTTYYWDDVAFGPSTVGIEDLLEMGLTYYPNPANDVLKISAERQIDEIQVYNLMGQQVMPSQAGRDLISVDMSTLSPGVYMVKVKAGETTGTFKVIKN